MSSFADCWRLASEINGWLTRREGRFLFEAARAVPAGGTIVEIGSFFGRSTVCLARGGLAGQRPAILAIDPQLGSPRHASLLACDDPHPFFLANLERAGVRSLVTPKKTTSVAAAADCTAPIDLLFIDGSHELEQVRADFQHWFPKLRPGGCIAFHDSWHMGGVRRLTSELLRAPSSLSAPRLIDTITACTRREGAGCHRLFLAARHLRGPFGFLRLTYGGTRLRPAGT
jgi:predicted O-methyltransferase YrrM